MNQSATCSAMPAIRPVVRLTDHRQSVTSRTVFTDVFVVSADGGGVWRVSDRGNDRILGPFSEESAAVSAAFDGVVNSRRWEIHVLDQCGTLVTSYNSEEDSLHVRAE
ncbi:MAG: hypothetical protein ABI822_01920 [Bryobacteraceae bacterium]